MFKKVVGSNPLKAIATRALSVQKTLASVAKISIPNQVNDWLNEDAQTFAKLQRVAKETSLRLLMDAFDNRKKLPKEIVLSILDASIITHKLLPNVLHIDRPRKSEDAVSRKNPFTGIITVVGDTHGQYDDFVQIFQNNKIGGFPSEQNQFVFNGDIVDRGPNAVEILMTLLFAKLQCPTSVHILRGNHESRYGTKHYGFLKEVLKKYDEAVFDKFLEFFDTLPICAVIENNTFVTHGGLGVLSHKSTVAEINQEDRFKEIIRGMLDELTWAGKLAFATQNIQNNVTSCYE